jgi:hypothetical protein
MNLINKIKNFFVKLTHFLPTKIPTGIAEFESWSSSIIKTYGFPDNDSVRWALAVKILHDGETKALRAKRYFYLAMHKSMANQVVSQVIQDIKTKQQDALAAAQAAEKEAAAIATKVEDVGAEVKAAV